MDPFSSSDKKILSSESQWLNDSIVNAAQLLLSESGAMIQGFQNTLLGKGHKFKAIKLGGAPFVQILHVNSNHWITTTNINCEAGEVRVFDSLYKPYVSLDIKKQVCSFLKPSSKFLTINIMDMQKQPDSSSCGLFAIAVATALTHGLDPVKLKWDVSKMRRHLQDCLETRKLTNFPIVSERKVCFGSIVSKSVKEAIYCTCRMPLDTTSRIIVGLVHYAPQSYS